MKIPPVLGELSRRGQHAQKDTVPHFAIQLSRGTAFLTRLRVHPAKAKISLRIRMKTLRILGYPQSALRRLRSDCADAQADLRLRKAHIQSCKKCFAPAKL